jgi:selenocysteine lyase/cysteine desulfurase
MAETTLGRRPFLARGARLIAGGVAGVALAPSGRAAAAPLVTASSSWDDVRAQFALAPGVHHFATWLLASHPRPVRDAIERYRAALDRDPTIVYAEEQPRDDANRAAAAAFLHAAPDAIALTDSTTMGLGLVYGGLRLGAGDEIVTTVHDHYATTESLRLRALRTGAPVRTIRLFRDAHSATEDEILSRLRAALRPRTAVIAITWVHSSTGMRLPIASIAAMVREASARAGRSAPLLCVDGVHALGVEQADVRAMGVDVLVAGTHKWLFGPRGTGIVWATPRAWARTQAIIPTFDLRSYNAWEEGHPPLDLPPAAALTPGGFHSFEHRWALADAFAFQSSLGGPARVGARTHALAARLLSGVGSIPGVRLATPRDPRLTAGLVCFDVQGQDARDVVDRLATEHRVIATVTPYAVQHVRLGPTIAQSESDVDAAVRAVAAVA